MTGEDDVTPEQQELVDFLQDLDEESVGMLVRFACNFIGTEQLIQALDDSLSSDQKKILSHMWVRR